MFGYLTARTDLLEPDQLERYRQCYCGLCRTLRKRFGAGAGLLLTYDMTFLILLLGSLYDAQEQTGDRACALHPRQPRKWVAGEFTEYAADMTVLLSWFKGRDSWLDDSNPMGLAFALLLKRDADRISRRYPRQWNGVRQAIEDLDRVEQQDEPAPDAAADCSGRMLAEIFACREDYWASALRRLGMELGRLIYLMDAALDLPDDVFWNSYNPFTDRYGHPDNPVLFRDILKMILSDCVSAFDYLPLVQDVAILKNILCVGVWQQFEQKFGDGRTPENGAGSVSGPRRVTQRNGRGN